MKQQSDDLFYILAALVLLLISYAALKNNSVRSKVKKTKGKLRRKTRTLKTDLYNKYDIVKEKAETALDTIK